MASKLVVARGVSLFRRILCAVDFSEGSRAALDEAAAMARLFGASVSVLYVHRTAVPVPASGYAGVLQPVALSDAERAHILQTLGEFVADHRRAGLAIDTIFDEDLVVPRAIVQSAAHLAADVIVVGTHGHSGFNRLVLGAVPNRVMKTAGRPVLVVPPRPRDTVPISFGRIVCPVDFGPASCRALNLAAAIAEQCGARVTVVHVVELGAEAADMPALEFAGYRNGRFEQARATIRDAIPAALRTLAALDDLLLVGKPYHEIVRLIAEQQADLVVMGVQGRGAVDPAIFGSTAHHVARQSVAPVLMVPAG